MFFPPPKQTIKQLGDPNLYYVPPSAVQLSAHEKMANAMPFDTDEKIRHGIVVMATYRRHDSVATKYAKLKLDQGHLFVEVSYPMQPPGLIKNQGYTVEVDLSGKSYDGSDFTWRFLTEEEDEEIRDPTKRPHRYIHDIP